MWWCCRIWETDGSHSSSRRANCSTEIATKTQWSECSCSDSSRSYPRPCQFYPSGSSFSLSLILVYFCPCYDAIATIRYFDFMSLIEAIFLFFTVCWYRRFWYSVTELKWENLGDGDLIISLRSMISVFVVDWLFGWWFAESLFQMCLWVLR